MFYQKKCTMGGVMLRAVGCTMTVVGALTVAGLVLKNCKCARGNVKKLADECGKAVEKAATTVIDAVSGNRSGSQSSSSSSGSNGSNSNSNSSNSGSSPSEGGSSDSSGDSGDSEPPGAENSGVKPRAAQITDLTPRELRKVARHSAIGADNGTPARTSGACACVPPDYHVPTCTAQGSS